MIRAMKSMVQSRPSVNRLVQIICRTVVFLPAATLFCRAESARIGISGCLSLKDAKISFSPAMAYPGWKFRSATVDRRPVARGVPWKILSADGSHVIVEGDTQVERVDANACTVVFRGKAVHDADVLESFVSLKLPTDRYAGGKMVASGRRVDLPQDFSGRSILASGSAESLFFSDSSGKTALRISLDGPCAFKLQDNREWNGTDFSLRLFWPLKGRRILSGMTIARTVGLRTPDALDLDHGTCRIEPGADWIPLTPSIDMREGSALDFRAFRGTEGPAGAYGYPVVRKGHFEFERLPGKPQRFYGANLVFSCNVPPEDESPRFAARLARIGYNAVRIHHHEVELVDETTGDLCAGAMRRFDALVAACIKEGLYLTTDLYVSRKVPWKRIGIDRKGFVPVAEFKELALIDGKAYMEFKRFAALFLNHVNPFTGRRYAEEPALGWLSLVNEGNIGNFDMKFLARHEGKVLPAWRRWLAENRRRRPDIYADVPETLPRTFASVPRSGHGNAFIHFLTDLETAFVERMKSFLRDELGCRALVTDMNCWFYPAAYLVSRGRNLDYVDDHFYIDHPRFLARDWALPSSCGNDNPFRDGTEGVPPPAVRRVFGKPFTISEYNFAAPGRFRGVGGIATGAVAALQDWDGLCRFAWSHDAEGVSRAKKLGYFDMSGDPLGLAAERASICLFLRRDLPPLTDTACYVLSSEDVRSQLSVADNPAQFPARIAWRTKVGLSVDAKLPGSREIGRYPGKVRLAATAKAGPVAIDPQKGSFVIVTPRTAGGFAEDGTIVAGPLTADLGKTSATVWASGLDDLPLESSRRVLVTHLTEIQNTGSVFDDDARTVLLDWGTLPHLMRAGRAAVSLETKNARATVWGLASDGTRRYEVPFRLANGILRFTADVARDRSDATCLYEIEFR